MEYGGCSQQPRMRGLLPWFTFSFFSDRKPGASLGEVRSTHVSTFPGAAGQALGGGAGPDRCAQSAPQPLLYLRKLEDQPSKEMRGRMLSPATVEADVLAQGSVTVI